MEMSKTPSALISSTLLFNLNIIDRKADKDRVNCPVLVNDFIYMDWKTLFVVVVEDCASL